MFARIDRMAVTGRQYPLRRRDWRSPFAFRNARRDGAGASTAVGEGPAGLDILSGREGDNGGIDHAGPAVEDMEKALNSPTGNNSGANIVKRLSCDRLAARRGHGADGHGLTLPRSGAAAGAENRLG